ncbi:MAG TPA: hypothetical protein PKZ20_17465, partial [Rhodocyclaceae bacterium]|nr:hypothetical protein [Rhodocyclaceae bacterium]
DAGTRSRLTFSKLAVLHRLEGERFSRTPPPHSTGFTARLFGACEFSMALPETRNTPPDGATAAQQCSSPVDNSRSSDSPKTVTAEA